MKSSSKFFAARLMSAEVNDHLAEDVYLLKPGNHVEDKSLEIALTHVSSSVNAGSVPGASAAQQSIVLLHGNYQNRRLWLTPGGDCMARRFARAGLSVWLVEFPGHGLAPINDGFNGNTLSGYGRDYIPAIAKFIGEQSASEQHWLGFGTGAGALLYAAALDVLPSSSIASLTGMGVPFYQAKWSRLPGVANPLAARRLQRNPDVGPDCEPLGVVHELLVENSWFAHRGASVGIDLWSEIVDKQIPLNWFGNSYNLDSYDAGFPRLRAAGLLRGLECDGYGIDDYTAENIAATLSCPKGVSAHADILLAGILATATRDDALRTVRETASAV